MVAPITPPPGSSISVATDGGVPVITIPQRSPGTGRFLLTAFLLFWLGGWSIGFYSAVTQVLSGKAGAFLILWLGGWTMGGAFVVLWLYRMFRPLVAQTLKLGINGVTYDPGVGPMMHESDAAKRKGAKNSLFAKRTIVPISRQDLSSLRLRETESENRLTVDIASARVDLACAASEVEREWLYRVLSERYSLSPE